MFSPENAATLHR